MKVAVGVITNEKQQILITQRPLHTSLGGRWEFPGGKLEANESPDEALVRELKEELGLIVSKYSFLGEIVHQYPERHVELLVYHVTEFGGIPQCLEGQIALKWLFSQELNPAEFPEANSGIFTLVEQLNLKQA